MSLELVMVAVLLNTKPDALSDAYDEVLRPTYIAVALNAELIDQRELVPYITVGLGIRGLIHERIEALRDTPALNAFAADPSTLKHLLVMNRTYRNWLNQRHAVDAVHVDDINDAICETDQLYLILDTLRDAATPYYYVTVRRQSLAAARRLLGDEAFYANILPPPVPPRHIPRK